MATVLTVQKHMDYLFIPLALAYVLQNGVSQLFLGSKKLVNWLIDRLINQNLHNKASNK